MISLALSISKPRSPSEIGDAGLPAAEGTAANDPFSALLASLGLQTQTAEDEIAGSAEAAANGIVLPLPAETGKILPDFAAMGSGDLPAEANDDLQEAEIGGALADTAAIAALLPLPAAIAADAVAPVEAEAAGLPVTAEAAALAAAAAAQPGQAEGSTATPETDAERSARPATARLAHQLPTSPATAEETALASAAVSAAAKREGGEKAEAPAVALHVAPEAAAGSARRRLRTDAEVQPVKGREAAVEGMLLAKAASGEPAPQAPASSFAQGLQAETAQAGRPLESARPALHADALQDLARVVDRLTAAREALAPTAAALAVKHAEFGDLSLRFDQQRDGHLAVQLSASDPEAHRAVAAAVNERSAASTADNHSGSNPSQAQTRGNPAERDSNGGHTANGEAGRRDQPQQARPGSKEAQPGSQRAGIFA